MQFEKNVGDVDRFVRTGLGAVALFVGTVAGLTLGYPTVGGLVALLGAILLASAAVRRCPVYRFVGVNTTSGRPEGSGDER